MKCRVITIYTLILSSSLYMVSAHGYKDACECMANNDRAGEELRRERVYTHGTSFYVPRGASPCQLDSPDSESRRWVDGRHTTGYGNFPTSKMPDRTIGTWCELEKPFGKLLLEMDIENAKIIAYFPEDNEEPYGIHAISTSSETLDEACLWMNWSLDGFAFVNDLNRMQLVYISDDKSFFVYENEVGLKRVGIVDDVITRNSGRVIEINSNHVVIEEMIQQSDPSKGWERVRQVKHIEE